MSRTDPQFNLRIPETLRDQVAAASKENGRSATAEILARLEMSFLKENPPSEFMPAEKVRELSAIARRQIPRMVRERILRDITRAIELGHGNSHTTFRDLELEQMPEQDFTALLDGVTEELRILGYQVEWDGGESVWITFDELEKAKSKESPPDVPISNNLYR
ncbi:Arc family DNA-binding protein [Pseudomonas sp. MWU12-2323]|nr:Arc family DNA-binding protein [Pseudomonas sp. MWU12-2323]